MCGGGGGGEINHGEYINVDQYQADKNYKRTSWHTTNAHSCSGGRRLQHNYGTERGPSKTSTVARLG